MTEPRDVIETPQVCLGIQKRGNRRLLTELFSGFDIVDIGDSIPAETDLCIVDEGGIERYRDTLSDWRATERPAYAPVLLLADAEGNPWRTYSELLGEAIDGIQPIPAPKEAIRNIVDALLETRAYAALARDRFNQLELYEESMDGASIGITIADASDPEYPLVYANNGFLELTGYSRSEFVGRSCRFLQGADTEEATVDTIRAALETETEVTVEIRNYRKDGEMFWNELHIEPIRNDDGRVTHYIGFQRDVTTRKERNILLKQYERIVQSVSDPILVVATGGQVLYANEAARATLGIATTDEDYRDALDTRQAAQLESAIAALTDSGETQSAELVVDGDHSGHVVLQMSVQRAQFDHDTERERILMVGRDVTSIRKHQNRLSVLDRVLRHNIRNKLTVVTGTIDHLDATVGQLETDEIREQLSRIEMAAVELLSISDAARQFNQTVDPSETDTVRVDLATVVAETVAELAERYPAAQLQVADAPAETAICPASIRVCIEYLAERFITSEGNGAVEIAVHPASDGTIELSVTGEQARLSELEQRVLTRGSEQPLEHAPGIELWLINWAVLNSGGGLRVSDNGHSVVLEFQAA